MGPTFVKTKWQESGLQLKQWMNEDQVSKDCNNQNGSVDKGIFFGLPLLHKPFIMYWDLFVFK